MSKIARNDVSFANSQLLLAEKKNEKIPKWPPAAILDSEKRNSISENVSLQIKAVPMDLKNSNPVSVALHVYEHIERT